MSTNHRPGDRPDKEKLTAVTAAAPCPVCGGGHKCSRGDGGLILCGRRDGPVPGFRHLGPSAGDPQFHLYRRDDGAEPPAGARTNRPKLKPPTEWGVIAARHAAGFTPEARDELAARLDLPADVFTTLPLLGYRPEVGPDGHSPSPNATTPVG